MIKGKSLKGEWSYEPLGRECTWEMRWQWMNKREDRMVDPYEEQYLTWHISWLHNLDQDIFAIPSQRIALSGMEIHLFVPNMLPQIQSQLEKGSGKILFWVGFRWLSLISLYYVLINLFHVLNLSYLSHSSVDGEWLTQIIYLKPHYLWISSQYVTFSRGLSGYFVSSLTYLDVSPIIYPINPWYLSNQDYPRKVNVQWLC